MAAPISIIRSLPGDCRSTTTVRSTANRTATAPPPIAQSTFESINSHPLFLPGFRLLRFLARLRSRTRNRRWLHRRFGKFAIERVGRDFRDHEDPADTRLPGAVLGALEALVADR